MAQEVTIRLADGTTYVAHDSVIAAARQYAGEQAPAYRVLRLIAHRIENNADEGPLLLRSEGGTWTIAQLSPAQVVGIFLTDSDADLGAA